MMKILPNGVAVIDGDTHHAAWCAKRGLIHDEWMAQHIRDLIKRHHVRVCVDAGANIGTLSRVMLDAGCKVYAFEPNPDAYECLLHNCPDEKLIPNPFGLSDRDAMAGLRKLDNAGASYVDPDGEPIQVVALDNMDIDPPQLVKLDIEGYELRALKGARLTIEEHRPVILTEVNAGALLRAGATEHELYQWIRELGYHTYVLQTGHGIGSPQYDMVCTPL